jgi:hypothetical protein
MTADHGDFEVECALAASGLLTRTELAELSEHAAHCVPCHDRLVEFRRAGVQFFLVHGLKNSGERLPKGMQQRFVARAIREGIPLRSSTQGVRFSALGSVTILLLALLLVVATLNNGSLPDTSQRPVALDKQTSTPKEIPAHAVAARRVLRRSPAAIRPPKVAPLFAPKLTFATNSEIIRHNAPHLLAECEQCTFAPLSFKSRFVFHGTLDPDTLRTGLKPDFKANVAHLVWSVVPQ